MHFLNYNYFSGVKCEFRWIRYKRNCRRFLSWQYLSTKYELLSSFFIILWKKFRKEMFHFKHFDINQFIFLNFVQKTVGETFEIISSHTRIAPTFVLKRHLLFTKLSVQWCCYFRHRTSSSAEPQHPFPVRPSTDRSAARNKTNPWKLWVYLPSAITAWYISQVAMLYQRWKGYHGILTALFDFRSSLQNNVRGIQRFIIFHDK